VISHIKRIVGIWIKNDISSYQLFSTILGYFQTYEKNLKQKKFWIRILFWLHVHSCLARSLININQVLPLNHMIKTLDPCWSNDWLPSNFWFIIFFIRVPLLYSFTLFICFSFKILDLKIKTLRIMNFRPFFNRPLESLNRCGANFSIIPELYVLSQIPVEWNDYYLKFTCAQFSWHQIL
jgi:hypothetical protein